MYEGRSTTENNRRMTRRDGEPDSAPAFSNPFIAQIMINGDGKMIKELRTQLGLSQREFGKRIGKTGAYISQVENGKMTASPETLATINRVFQVGKVDRVGEETTFAERLKQARKARDFTQGELAKAVECNRNTISAAEAGKSKPSSKLIHDIAEKLWISEDWLRFGIGQMERSERVAEVLEAIRSDPNVREAVMAYLTKSQDC